MLNLNYMFMAAALATAPAATIPVRTMAPVPQATTINPVEKSYADLTHQYHWAMFNQQENLGNQELLAQNIILAGVVRRDMSGVEEQVSTVLRECRRERDGYISDVDAFAQKLYSIEARIEQASPSPDYRGRKTEFHLVLDQHRRNLPQNCTLDRVMMDLKPVLELGK